MRSAAKNLRSLFCKKPQKHPNSLKFSFFERGAVKTKQPSPQTSLQVQPLASSRPAKAAAASRNVSGKTSRKNENAFSLVLPPEMFQKTPLFKWAKAAAVAATSPELPKHLYIIEFIQAALLKLEQKQVERWYAAISKSQPFIYSRREIAADAAHVQHLLSASLARLTPEEQWAASTVDVYSIKPDAMTSDVHPESLESKFKKFEQRRNVFKKVALAVTSVAGPKKRHYPFPGRALPSRALIEFATKEVIFVATETYVIYVGEPELTPEQLAEEENALLDEDYCWQSPSAAAGTNKMAIFEQPHMQPARLLKSLFIAFSAAFRSSRKYPILAAWLLNVTEGPDEDYDLEDDWWYDDEYESLYILPIDAEEYETEDTVAVRLHVVRRPLLTISRNHYRNRLKEETAECQRTKNKRMPRKNRNHTKNLAPEQTQIKSHPIKSR